MSHLCYVYINQYKCLKDIEVVIDCHYDYSFDKHNKKLTIKKNEAFPENFWGKNIYSITGLVGNNGSGKSTVMSFLLDFLVEGSACRSINGVVVYEQNEKLYYYGEDILVVFNDNQVKSYDTSMGVKDSIWKIPCFYYSGHFSPFINNDSRNFHLSGSVIASDNILLVEDLQNYYGEDSLHMNLPLIRHLNSHVAQNNYRICMMLANNELSGVIKDFAWPRFVVIQINKSGAISIENEIRKENQKRREFNQHNEIFKAYNENARAFKDQGKYDKALEYYEQSLKECNRIFEEEGPESANIYDNMAMVYNSKGEFAKAVEYNSKALAIWEKYFGAEHASAASTYNNIGSVYKDQGDYEKAMEYYSKALAIREKDFGIDNSTTAASYNNIGSVYEKQGDYNKALEFYSKALAIWEKHLGKDNQTIAQSYNNIGTIYDNQGDYDKALEYFLKALEINEKHLGTEHPDTATSYNNIGSLYDNLGNYDKALEYYFKALAIREKVYGKKQMDTAASYNNIGTVFWRKGDYNLSLQYFYKALSVREDVFGRFHPATAQSYNNIGAVHEYQGDFDKALEYYLKGLEIREKVLGTEHPDTATSYFNTAGVYFRLGDYSTAMDYSNKAYQVFNKVLGPKHPYTELVLSWINEIKNIINKDVQVKENYKNEIIGEKDLGAEEPEKITIDSDVAMVNKEKGDFVIAESNQKEQNTELSIPPFKTVFEPTSKDNFISLLIYHNLLNIINDTWGWKNGFGIVNDWQNRIDNETPVMDQFFSYINSITDEEKSKTLKSLYNIVLEIQNHTSYKSVIQGDGFLYIDCEKSTDNLINLGDRVLSRNKFYLTSKFFDFSYAQTLDSETILSSGEQELLNLFSRFYDSAVLHPAKFSNIQSPSILMLDEAEIGFHPDWQRKYLKLVIDFINALKMIKPDNQDFQIIISTHSPILLSDIPKCCTNYFERIDNLTTKVDKDEIGETFAANVFNLYRMSFFMKDGLVGEFARTRIKELDKRIDSGETEGVMNEIRMIGDDGIREYLLDKYQTKHPIDKQVKEDVIRYYQEKIDQLNEGIK